MNRVEAVPRHRRWLYASAYAALGLFHGFILYGSAGRDDSHITYAAARALAETGRILNINGDAVEQSSSLLHVLVLALLSNPTRTPLPTLGVLFSAAAWAAATMLAWSTARQLNLPYPASVAIYLGVFPYGVYWAFSGLETSLSALVLLCAALCLARFLSSSLLLTGGTLVTVSIVALMLVRPESVFVLATSLLFLALLLFFARRNEYPSSRILFIAAVSALVFAAVSLYRLVEFEQLFPQAIYAKSAGDIRIVRGLKYLMVKFLPVISLDLLTAFGLLTLLPLVLPRFRVAGFRRPPKAPGTYLLVLICFVVAQLAFVVASGGDWMEGGRFLVPVLAPIALIGFCGISLFPKRVATGLTAAVLLVAVTDLYRFQEASTGIPLWNRAAYRTPVLEDFEVGEDSYSWFDVSNRVHLRDVPIVETLADVVRQLRDHRARPISVFSIQMGMVPYYLTDEHAGHLRFVDMASLVTRDFTDCRLTASVRRTALGAVVTYRDFFENETAFREQCGIRRPDVIFDLGEGPKTEVEQNGYRIVFSVSGELPGKAGRRVSAQQFIGVREPLAGFVDVPRPSYVWPKSRVDNGS